jgi:NADH:ubiquinone oxidoreductase subunit 3 (subunit A)
MDELLLAEELSGPIKLERDEIDEEEKEIGKTRKTKNNKYISYFFLFIVSALFISYLFVVGYNFSNDLFIYKITNIFFIIFTSIISIKFLLL